MTFHRVKKNVRVVDDENTLQCCFSPGFLLSSESALRWPSIIQDSTLPSSAWTGTELYGTQCMLLHREEIQLDGNAAGRDLEAFDLPFLLPSDSSHGLIPIDHIWERGTTCHMAAATAVSMTFRGSDMAQHKAGPLFSWPLELTFP